MEARSTVAAGKPGQRTPTKIIEPPKKWAPLKLKELWKHRDLFYFLAWRDLKIRYKQTELGAAWAIIQPFFMMVVFNIFFGKMAGIKPGNDIPYPIFVYTGLLPWTYFSNAISYSGNSMVANASLVTKVYFPRLIIPTASIAAGLVDFGISFSILIAMMFYYGMWPSAAVLALPVLILLATLTALGVGLWLSALSVEYRDVKYVIPFLTQFWLFVTPVIYPVHLLPEKWRILYALNPMVGVVEGFRWALLSEAEWPGMGLLVSMTVALLILVSGLFYFRRMEKNFADVI